MENKKPQPSGIPSAYRKTEVMTANKETILLMMYAGAIRFLKQALTIDIEKEKAERTRLIGRTQEIVTELRSTLNFEIGKEIAEHLDSIYVYVAARLMSAITDGNNEPLEEAIRLLSTLNDAWAQAIESLRKERQLEKQGG